MSSESQNVEEPKGASGSQDSTSCPNCRASLPQGMRFCRLCGFRLGEGVEEYTETVRLGNQPRTATAAGAAQQPRAPFSSAQQWGAMSHAGADSIALGRKKRKSKGPHWIVWVILSIVIASVAGGSFIKPLKLNIGGPGGVTATASQSKVGASSFSTADGGGAMIESVTPPDAPMDKAGLIGGDIVKSFDGQAVNTDSELRKQIAATPIGKTVEVIYVRDGETKNTKLTTVSESEMDRLTEIADKIPDGFLGVDSLDRVAVPNTNLYGVRVGNVRKNRPANMYGLQDGDIIIDFGGTPIRTPEELGARIDRATPYSTIKTVVMRGTERVELEIKIGIDD
jgi:S1-C subfamily serine protease